MTQTEPAGPRAPDWAGPPEFLPPPPPRLREDGVTCYGSVTYAMPPGYRPLKLDLWVPPGETAPPQLAVLLSLTGDDPGLEGDLGVVGPSTAVDAVVDWYGPTDMDTMTLRALPIPGAEDPVLQMAPEEILLRDADEATRAAASPVRHVSVTSPPFLIQHGTADSVVPFAQGQALADALAAAGVPVTLVPVDGADHIFGFHPDVDAIVAQSVDFLCQHLAPGVS